MVASQKRIQAARLNGARSRGPVTEEGKARSSRNAIRHGLLSDCVVVGSESRDSFQQLLDLHLQRFAPVDEVEFGMIEEMAAAYWRLRRAWSIETQLLTAGMEQRTEPSELARIAGAFSDLAATPQLALLNRYETRLHLMYQRAFHNLLVLRNTSVRNEPKTPNVCNTAPRELAPPADLSAPSAPHHEDDATLPELQSGSSAVFSASPRLRGESSPGQPRANLEDDAPLPISAPSASDPREDANTPTIPRDPSYAFPPRLGVSAVNSSPAPPRANPEEDAYPQTSAPSASDPREDAGPT